ncbi:HpcH/HpaI aldolase family protein [Roseomonas sp. BN140053]|uniref:HpcH/HpaI aldolase family protein n=1 Tax=Roseomonas sp. BN140053 TaxID=3391898 RepID=UPI0039EA215D
MIRRDMLAGGALAAAGVGLAAGLLPGASAQPAPAPSPAAPPPAAPSPTAPVRAADLLRNPAKDKLRRGEVVVSMSVRLVRSMEIAQIAASSGFDSLYVEMQHSTFTEEQISNICQAALGAGITAMVRVPSIRPEHVGRVLDGGALGIIAPEIETVEEVRQVVAAARFPPWGNRSAPGGQLFPLRYRSFPTAETYAAINDATMVVVMLENTAALERVEEIAAVEGLDMLFIGTSDLTNSMGLVGQPDHPRVRDAFARTIEACRRHGKHVGIGGLAARPDLIAQYLKMGARFVSSGTDLTFLLGAAAARAKQIRDIAV